MHHSPQTPYKIGMCEGKESNNVGQAEIWVCQDGGGRFTTRI